MTRISRRTILGAAAMSAMVPTLNMVAQSTPVAPDLVDELVIDLPQEPVNIHPARAYSDIEWTIVHSVFDALIGFDTEGVLRPIAAERFELIDDVTWEVVLRPGMTFHDGSAVTAAAIVRGFDLVTASDSQVSDIFGVVNAVEEIDDLTARITVSTPSPWMPAQMASWHVLVPKRFDPETMIGSGPYTFEGWARGEVISLKRFAEYMPSAAKGTPITNSVRFHFVPEAATRSSNLLSGTSNIATFMPIDAVSGLTEEDLELRTTQVAGSWFVRIATDAAPFDDPRVRQALNLALDLDSFVGALVPDGSERLASLYPGPVAMGFDPGLAPYAYDQEAARSLLVEADLTDGLKGRLELSSDASQTIAEAMVSQWAQVGIDIEIVVSDIATFNSTWQDPEAPELRLATWSPLYDPSTLLNLVFWSEGFLSRYSNAEADALIMEGGSATNQSEREQAYQDLGSVMHTDAAAVFLWNLVNVAGVSAEAAAWTSRADQWVLPLAR